MKGGRLTRTRVALSLLIAMSSATAQAGLADQAKQLGPTSRWAGATSSATADGTSGLPFAPSTRNSQSAVRDDYALLPTERRLMVTGAQSSRHVARRHGSSRRARSVGLDFEAKARDMAEIGAPWSNSPWTASPWAASPP